MTTQVRYITTREAAQMLGLCVGTLRNWRATGRGPVFVRLGKLGGVVRYKESEVVAYMDRNRIEPLVIR